MYSNTCLYGSQSLSSEENARLETAFYSDNRDQIAYLVSGALSVNEKLRMAGDETLQELAKSTLLAEYHENTLDIIYTHAEQSLKRVPN